MQGCIVTGDAKDGSNATTRAGANGRLNSKTFPRRKDADKYLTEIQPRNHERQGGSRTSEPLAPFVYPDFTQELVRQGFAARALPADPGRHGALRE